MTPASRPRPREIFLSKEKQPLVYFYTSNIEKFLQARLVFETAGLLLQHFRSRQEPYREDYALGKLELLARAIEEIIGSVGAGSLLFVEDTSLRIDALSTTDDFPGLAVKEWFPSVTFQQLDEQLKNRGNNRRAAVKSDIALHIPGLNRAVYFHGETVGHVASEAPCFPANPQYPWLTPTTFNGWIIPEGACKRLGEMAVEESWAHDFRTIALERLLERLEEYTGVLNLAGPAYRIRPHRPSAGQLSLLAPEPAREVLIVIGKACAGKTTLAEYAKSAHSLSTIEASSVVRMLATEARITGPTAFEIARSVLERYGSDIVARKIVDLYRDELRNGVVISGFRTIEELEIIKNACPHARVAVIEANERTRFERCLARDRASGPKTMKDFKRIEADQWSLGLVRFAQDFADIRITNESTMDDYQRAVNAVLTKANLDQIVGVSARVQPRVPSHDNQLFRCLAALRSAGMPLTCDEITRITSQTGRPVRHNNANKVLKRAPELARRLDLGSSKVRYEVRPAGLAYVRYMDRYIGAHRRGHSIEPATEGM